MDSEPVFRRLVTPWPTSWTPFPIVRRRDEEKHGGDYRTKRVILEIYDEMLRATRTGETYRSRLTPPPRPQSAATRRGNSACSRLVR